MIPMFPKGYEKDKWYKVEEAMPGKELEEWPHGLLLSTKDKNSGKEKIQVGWYDSSNEKWIDSQGKYLEDKIVTEWHVTPVLWVGDEVKAFSSSLY